MPGHTTTVVDDIERGEFGDRRRREDRRCKCAFRREGVVA